MSCEMSTDTIGERVGVLMIGERGERPTVTVAKQIDESGEDRGEESGQLLLPGIPDAITVNHIIPKLLIFFSPLLSLVSSGWRKAIQSDEVYSAKARSHATETLVVLNFRLGPRLNQFALYSRRDNFCFLLPQIPGFDCGIPWSCNCISLDRKVYVIGGEGDRWGYGYSEEEGEEEDTRELDRGVEVYVLDLAGPSLKWKWKRCADMQQPRKAFGCGVKDGKIYVFGGTDILGHSLCESEVYDPKTNSWSPIPPMKCSRYGHHVGILGEELVVYGGCVNVANGLEEVYDLEFYHPGTNEWRKVDTLRRQGYYRLFLAHKKFYAMTSLGIYVYDDNIGEHSWTEVHSFTHPALEWGSFSEDENWCPLDAPDGELFSTICNRCPVLAVNDELLSVFQWINPTAMAWEWCLLQSKGFGSKNKELVWEKALCDFSFDVMPSAPLLCPITL